MFEELQEWFFSRRLSSRIIEGLIVIVAIAIAIQFFASYDLLPFSRQAVDTNLILSRASSAATQGKEALAIQEYTRAIVLDEDDPRAYAARGKLYYAQREYELALNDFNHAIRLGFAKPDVFYYRAQANLQTGNYDHQLADDFIYSGQTAFAIATLSEILEQNPSDPWTLYTARADIYAEIDDYEAALADYNRALELNPQYYFAYTNRGELYRRMRDEQAAQVDQVLAHSWANLYNPMTIQMLNDLIENLDDNSPEAALAHFNRAFHLSRIGEYQAAIADYSTAITIDPGMHDAYMGRGYMHAELFNNQVKAGADFLQRMNLLKREEVLSTMEIGETVEVEMAFGRVYKIAFEGRGGEIITISARAANYTPVDPLIVLVDQNGNPLIGDDDLGPGGSLDSRIDAFELPQDGVYTLFVSHANGGRDGLIEVMIR